MKRKIYLETSVISYLTAKPSQNPVATNRQLQARLLWESPHFTHVISDVVMDEISFGDKTQAQSRLDLLNRQLTLEKIQKKMSSVLCLSADSASSN